MLDHEDIERLKEIFVPRSECDTQMATVREKQNNVEVRLAVIENEVKKSTKLQWTILMAVLSAIVAAVMGMILK